MSYLLASHFIKMLEFYRHYLVNTVLHQDPLKIKTAFLMQYEYQIKTKFIKI